MVVAVCLFVCFFNYISIYIYVIANMLFAKSSPLDFPSFVAQESCGLQQLLKNH